MGKRKRADFSSHLLALRSFSSIKVGLLLAKFSARVLWHAAYLYYIILFASKLNQL